MLIETESHSQNELLSNCLPILNVRRKRRTTTLLIPVAVRADWRVFLRRSRRILLLRRERSRQRILREGSLVRWHGWLLTYRVFSLVRWHGSSLSSGGIARPSSSLGLTETESRWCRGGGGLAGGLNKTHRLLDVTDQTPLGYNWELSSSKIIRPRPI